MYLPSLNEVLTACWKKKKKKPSVGCGLGDVLVKTISRK